MPAPLGLTRAAPADRLLVVNNSGGNRGVIVTACADPLASAVCAELGLSEVEMVAARLRAGRTVVLRADDVPLDR